MTASVVILPNTNDSHNVVGEAHHADGWYGFSDGLHTVAIHTANFTGRVFIQASLALEPTEDDWFDIHLTAGTPYVQFPLRPSYPTGHLEGDTGVFALTFNANVMWIRARLDRSYIPVGDPNDNRYGVISKIVLSR